MENIEFIAAKDLPVTDVEEIDILCVVDGELKRKPAEGLGATSQNADWNAAEGEPGYIKNKPSSLGGVTSWNDLQDKPFGEVENGRVVIIDGKAPISGSYLKALDIDHEDELFAFFLYLQFVVVFDGTEYKRGIRYYREYSDIVDDEECMVSEGIIGNAWLHDSSKENTGEPFCFFYKAAMDVPTVRYYSSDNMNHTVSVYGIDTKVEKINLRYLPYICSGISFVIYSYEEGVYDIFGASHDEIVAALHNGYPVYGAVFDESTSKYEIFVSMYLSNNDQEIRMETWGRTVYVYDAEQGIYIDET